MFLSNFFYRIVFLTRNRYTGDKLAFNIYSVGILQRRVLGIVFFLVNTHNQLPFWFISRYSLCNFSWVS